MRFGTLLSAFCMHCPSLSLASRLWLFHTAARSFACPSQVCPNIERLHRMLFSCLGAVVVRRCVDPPFSLSNSVWFGLVWVCTAQYACLSHGPMPHNRPPSSASLLHRRYLIEEGADSPVRTTPGTCSPRHWMKSLFICFIFLNDPGDQLNHAPQIYPPMEGTSGPRSSRKEAGKNSATTKRFAGKRCKRTRGSDP